MWKLIKNHIENPILESRGILADNHKKIVMVKKEIDRSLYPGILDWSGYKNTTTMLPCKCEDCGADIKRCIQDFTYRKLGYKCKTCANISNGKVKLKEINRNDYPFVKDWSNYENQNTKLLCQCTECGGDTYKTIHWLKCNNNVCHCEKCSYKLRGEAKIGNTYLSEYAKKTYGVNNYSQRNRSKENIEITSSKEKLEEYLKSFDTKPTVQELGKILEYSGTGNLYEKINQWELRDYIDYYTSKPEREILNFIKNCGLNPIKKTFSWGEIDIFIEDKKIGFEFNGCYWHSSKRLDKNYHQNKRINAKNDGIELFFIWEDEWYNKQEIIKSWIKSKFGLNKTIMARKCEIVKPSVQEQRDFYYINHLQSYTYGNSLALKYNGEIVSMMTVGKSNRSKNLTINRFANKLGINVAGGFTKLFNQFDLKNIETFIDLDKFNANSYIKNNWKLIKECNADYFIIDDKLQRFNKSSFIKSKIINSHPEVDNTLTEWEMIDKIGYYRCYNSGKLHLISQ